jgi:hypothetical protein
MGTEDTRLFYELASSLVVATSVLLSGRIFDQDMAYQSVHLIIFLIYLLGLRSGTESSHLTGCRLKKGQSGTQICKKSTQVNGLNRESCLDCGPNYLQLLK